MSEDKGKIAGVYLDLEAWAKLERMVTAEDRSRSYILRRLVRAAPEPGAMRTLRPKRAKYEVADG